MKKRAKNAKSLKRARQGKLPPGVTHEIIAKGEDGLLIIKRRRFSLA